MTESVTQTHNDCDRVDEQGGSMGNVIVGMTMSLDGFVEDRNESVEALYSDLTTLRTTAPLREAIQNTGAVVMGWNALTVAKDPDF